ncbi:MAG: hypothetical protein K2O16_15530 [Lachnospiraceae bacterium]|nr:hypothetical protein [Lachnospiraceae bacterium]MDE7333598.1 hypothetical protein [Lachnospiraceae bacterium]
MWENRLSALLIALTMFFLISGCTIQGNDTSDSAPDVVHQTEDDGTAIYVDDPIAEEPQLDVDDLKEVSEDSNGQGEIISAEPHEGNAD